MAHIAGTGRPTALLIGHPGHELRVYGWSRLVHPSVYVLTDGSGTTGMSRLERTTHLLSGIGAKPGTVYGRLTDREIYHAMMAGETARFTEMVDELARAWTVDEIEVAASDANEGYSATHDLCCEMARAATELVRVETGRQIQLYTFCLTEWESAQTEDLPEDSVCVRLSDEVRDEKIAAAKSYAELGDEVERALALVGPEYFGEEYLVPARAYTGKDGPDKPDYERSGEQRVAEGKYTNVLRYEHHVLPVFQALRKHISLRADLIKANA